MSDRPLRHYRTVFKVEGDSLHELEFETIGVTPCAAKACGFILLELHLKSHPDLPRNGWWVFVHEQCAS